ncbi:hypothetical protein [Sorangium sp. So ce1151]
MTGGRAAQPAVRRATLADLDRRGWAAAVLQVAGARDELTRSER